MKASQPLWKDWDLKAQKCGKRHTVFSVSGDQYIGEWKDNKKHGKGKQIWKKTGAVFDGDWQENKRHGYGTYSLPTTEGNYQRVYSGEWLNDQKHGHGTCFYSEKSFYEGEWSENMRSGWGCMYYNDGSIYEGEWFADMRNGNGMLRLVNENRYEGEWRADKKHGDGKFYHLDKGHIFVGVWVEDIAKCGEMKDFNRQNAVDASKYPIPELKLKDPEEVIAAAKETLNI